MQFFASERLTDVCTLSMLCSTVSILKGVITYLLWQYIQLEGVFKEVVSGAAVLQRKVFEKISELLKCVEHSHNNNKRGCAVLLQADIVLVE